MTPPAFLGPTSANSQSLPRAGTPPISRSSSSSSYPKRSSVVPFTRPTQRTSTDDGSEAGSSQPGTPGLRPPRRTSSSSHGFPRSFDDFSYSHSPRRRDDSTSSRSRGASPPVVREEGFHVAQADKRRGHHGPVLPYVGEESPRGSGLLSKAFSGALGSGSPVPSGEVLKERLQKCLDQLSAQRLPAVESDGAAGRLLKRLQADFEVFEYPSVVASFWAASNVLRHHHHHGSGQPPMVRNLETAAILAELGASTACVSAALFHSVLERRAMSEAQLRETLQPDVASLVVSSARLADLCKVRQQASQMDADTMRKFSHMLLAMADVQAVIIVLSDRLQMLRGGDYTPAEAREVLDVFVPLADQLGVWSLKADLEDLAFQALYPQEHAELRARLQASLQSRTIERSLDALKEAVGSRGITNVDLVGRPKNLYSVWKKMKAKGYGLEQLYDLRALRIVVRSKADCYWALREVEQLWPVVAGRDKDYIRQPKANGYQSLHTVVLADDGVPMEVQIRTDKMHFIAEYGVAAHWRYKEDADVRDVAREQQVAWARMLISWQLELADKKLRPAGSPAHDTTLSHICPFPVHEQSCPARDVDGFLARHAPRPQSQNGDADVPVYVVVLDHTASPKGRHTVAIKELPGNSTANQLHELLQLQRAAAHGSCAATHLLVNGAEAGEHQLLSHGDKVEVVAAYPPARPAQTGQALNLSHSIPAEARIPPSADQPYSPGRLRRQTAALRN